MYNSPLDVELSVGSVSGIKKKMETAQVRLSERYNIPFHDFAREIFRRLMEQEIPEEPDVMYWQSLYSILLDWAKKGEPEDNQPDPLPEQVTEGAANGGLFFVLFPVH